jgi:acyl phosphate:glycerol-3-phosphate acyltransferase
MVNVLSVIIAYLLGSIQISVILSKFFKFPDPRSRGSHSAGATNVLRTAGKNPALITLIGDVLKGVLAVLIAIILHAIPFFWACAALAAVAGHIFPCFFHFRGGKGVATGLGGLFMLSPFIAILLAVIWLVVVLGTRYVSLGSLITAAAAPILILIFSSERIAFFVPVLLMAGLIIWKHQDNIKRLRNGTESKVNLKTR